MAQRRSAGIVCCPSPTRHGGAQSVLAARTQRRLAERCHPTPTRSNDPHEHDANRLSAVRSIAFQQHRISGRCHQTLHSVRPALHLGGRGDLETETKVPTTDPAPNRCAAERKPPGAIAVLLIGDQDSRRRACGRRCVGELACGGWLWAELSFAPSHAAVAVGAHHVVQSVLRARNPCVRDRQLSAMLRRCSGRGLLRLWRPTRRAYAGWPGCFVPA